jgi:hypothetical protein
LKDEDRHEAPPSRLAVTRVTLATHELPASVGAVTLADAVADIRPLT